MKCSHWCVSIALMAVSAPAAAQYGSTPAIPAFDHSPYVQMVADLHEYYIGSPQAGGTLPQRMNERNRLVRALFDRIEADRHPQYASHQIYQAQHIRCRKSGRGGTKRCPAEINWGSGYEVIPASMGDTDRHFKEGPTNHGYKITAVLGRAGRGTNTGDFWGTAKLSAAEAERRVAAEKQALRNVLIARNLPTDKAIDMEVE